MNNHTKLTPEQYEAVTRAREATYASGKVTRHRPAHNFPVGMTRNVTMVEMQAEMEDKLRPMVKEVTQLKFTVAAQDALIGELMKRMDKLEAKEFARNLPSNQAARGESE